MGTQRRCSPPLLFPGHLSGYVGVSSRNKWSENTQRSFFFIKDTVEAERKMCGGKEKRLIFPSNVETDCDREPSCASVAR